MVTEQLLAENKGPHNKNAQVGWNVSPEFRLHYWASLWNNTGDKLFLHLWKHTPNKDKLDLDSLFWILLYGKTSLPFFKRCGITLTRDPCGQSFHWRGF